MGLCTSKGWDKSHASIDSQWISATVGLSKWCNRREKQLRLLASRWAWSQGPPVSWISWKTNCQSCDFQWWKHDPFWIHLLEGDQGFAVNTVLWFVLPCYHRTGIWELERPRGWCDTFSAIAYMKGNLKPSLWSFQKACTANSHKISLWMSMLRWPFWCPLKEAWLRRRKRLCLGLLNPKLLRLIFFLELIELFSHFCTIVSVILRRDEV